MTTLAMTLTPSALIPAAAFSRALKLLGKVVERRDTLPILTNVMLASSPGGFMISGKVEGVALEIGFNARYLLDILDQFAGEPVTMAMGDRGAPARFDGRSTYVLMPMRV